MTRSTLATALLISGVCALGGCDKKDEGAKPAEAKPAESQAAAAKPMAAPSGAAAAEAMGHAMVVSKVKGSFLIDAPLEKIKGASEEGKGTLDVDPKDLTKSKGEIAIKLTSLSTNTFGDKKKDDSQTEHARNWMEVGPESPAAKKSQFEYVKLTIKSVETATPKLADVKEEGGARVVKAKVTGDLWLHGVTSQKVVPVTVTFKGPADAPTEVTIKSDEPMPVSLKEHSIMPRDGIGSFLNGALEKIGKKIDDKVQVSVEATATKKLGRVA